MTKKSVGAPVRFVTSFAVASVGLARVFLRMSHKNQLRQLSQKKGSVYFSGGLRGWVLALGCLPKLGPMTDDRSHGLRDENHSAPAGDSGQPDRELPGRSCRRGSGHPRARASTGGALRTWARMARSRARGAALDLQIFCQFPTLPALWLDRRTPKRRALSALLRAARGVR